jgi:glucose/mannose-6-phosphate isomerase
MLDDLKYIHEKDAQDALGKAEHQAEQLRHDFDIPSLPGPYDNIVFAGMGGSALSALLSKTWPAYKVPFEIVRNYTIPPYVGERTLFIASSYSGNTEETISALEQAATTGAHIAVISSGGKLADFAREHNHAYAAIPTGYQPRHAVLYMFRALVLVLEHAGLVAVDQAEAAIRETADFVGNAMKAWLPDVPTAQNPAKQLALELAGKSVVVYGGPQMFPAVYKWKISFNENAKNIAWCDEIPEFNHNEFLGWTSHPVDKPYAVVDLRSNLEHERVQKRFVVTERLLSGLRPAPHVVKFKKALNE